jgi:hypothetical protein
MVLSIKDPEADRLARAVATRTGETLTQAVINALRDRLAREERKQENMRAGSLTQWKLVVTMPPCRFSTSAHLKRFLAMTQTACRGDRRHLSTGGHPRAGARG